MRSPLSRRSKIELDGAVVAVTGAAQGIGLAIATHFAARGAKVALGDLNGPAAEGAAHALNAQRCRGYQLDVTKDDSFAGFLEKAATDLGPIDVLVNNAGVMWVGPFDQEPTAAAEAMLAVNLLGTIRGVKLAAPAMRERRHGQIITVVSAASRIAPAGEATYGATKHGVLGYLTAIREELRGTGVQITAIMPAVVDTELAAGTSAGSVGLLKPDDVANAVIEVAGTSRFQVWIPGRLRPMVAGADLLPQALKDRLMRFAVPNQVQATAGSTSRADYEKRITEKR